MVHAISEPCAWLLARWHEVPLSQCLEQFRQRHSAALLAQTFAELQVLATVFELRISP